MKNCNRHITLILLLILGFILTPNLSYACSKTSTKTEHQKVSKNLHKRAGKKDCCEDKSCKNHQKDNDCGGQCKDSSCRCGNSSFSILIFTDLKSNISFDTVENHQSELTQSYYSLGYYSIWQPPKIG